MADSELSASELRKRYLRGGTLKDDELSAQQLRARHGVPSNKLNDSDISESSSSNTGMLVIGTIVILLVLAGVLYAKSLQ